MKKDNFKENEKKETNELKIEKIKIEDFKSEFAEDLFQIHLEEMPLNDQMTKENFLEEFSAPTRKYFVATSGNEVVGYLGLFECDDDENIIGIAIKKSFQNKGVGTKLIENGVNFARNNKMKSLSLEVDEANSLAISFYKKCDFVVTNVRKNYYKDSDAFVMFRYL